MTQVITWASSFRFLFRSSLVFVVLAIVGSLAERKQVRETRPNEKVLRSDERESASAGGGVVVAVLGL